MFSKILLITFFLFNFYYFINSQENFEKSSNYFGFQIKPIIPNNFISQKQTNIKDGILSTKYDQQISFSFGAITRINLTKLLNFETGINMVRRNFNVSFNLQDSSIQSNTKLSVINYDIPLNIMIYIQMSNKIYMNTSLGTSINFYPSNVGVVKVEDPHVFLGEGRRIKHFGASLNGNFGFEYRSKNSGFYYIGASALIPFKAIYYLAGSYEYNNSVRNSGFESLNGSYLTVDFRYFFPINQKSKNPMLQGPITQ